MSPTRRPPPAAMSVVESSIPEGLTLAEYRALRAHTRRRGLRVLPRPAAIAARLNRNRSKEVEMDAVLAGRGGRRRWVVAVVVVGLAALFVLALVEPSLAASKVGRRLGDEIETWGKAILLGVVGLVAIPVLAKRDVAGGAVVAMLAVLVGGFVFAPGAVKGVISGMWRAIGG